VLGQERDARAAVEMRDLGGIHAMPDDSRPGAAAPAADAADTPAHGGGANQSRALPREDPKAVDKRGIVEGAPDA
jgi:hypothetical protein